MLLGESGDFLPNQKFFYKRDGAWCPSKQADKLLTAPHRAFGLGFGFVAGLAKDLQIGVVICTTDSSIDNVVKLQLATNPTARLAGVVVPSQDFVFELSPSPTTTTFAPVTLWGVGGGFGRG